MELKLSQSSLPTPINNPFPLIPKQFALFSQRWKLNIQRIAWKGPFMSKKILVHVVKEGETLTSISKLYGVPVLEIADSNKEIVDVNVVFEGQQLKIPSAASECAQLCDFEGRPLPNESPRLGFQIRQWKNQISTLPFHQVPIAKAFSSFPVMVAAVAFCIGCIIAVFQITQAKNSRHKAANKLTNSARWRTALTDLRDPDSLHTESPPDSDLLLDDEEQLHFEDSSRDFNELEGDYEKFLSECGMSSYGYWRGGSPQ
ncbi:hypothetical protein SASPL_103525 [Salvia splendens]|uniref:LysM domain-containing protein n=1 Tax=Salvia splendens TaxID=180675 RepID=A0A8X9A851_SALSN|nr:uncharacterized protein LOC121759961 isoform X2 [Salvia splendens]KAG6431953.1 hypothetical protein SASPL_103525 [Salvia splendens]